MPKKSKGKKPSKKNAQTKDNVVKAPLTDQEKNTLAFNIAQEHLGGLADKKGFEAYQCLRDFLISMFVEPEKAKLFETDQSHYRIIGDFQLFDPAYLDNFMLCLTVKLTAPKTYEDTVKLIDKYVRPKTKKEEGLDYLYQECAGFLTFLLNHYEKVSIRHALRISSQLVKFSESTIEKSYRARMIELDKKITEDIPPILPLTLLYLILHLKNINPDAITPFKNKNDRSKKEIQKAVAAYWRLTEKIVHHAQENVLAYLKEYPVKIIPFTAKEFGVKFPLSEQDMQKPNHLTVLFLLGITFFIGFMPQVILSLEQKLPEQT